MVEPKYKQGDLVWRERVGFGIIAEVYEANLTDEEILTVYPGDRYIYAIMWDHANGVDHAVMSGFREIEIDEMKRRMENASTG